MAVARNLWGYIDRRDHRLMRRMNRWRAPRWIRIWMIAATRMGDGWSKVLPPDQFSFPSGHTMTAFSIALVVSYFYPSLEGVLFFLALSIAVSRIVLGMHFLSDVLAGVVMGVALGCASITAFASFGLI